MNFSKKKNFVNKKKKDNTKLRTKNVTRSQKLKSIESIVAPNQQILFYLFTNKNFINRKDRQKYKMEEKK